jgi:hypothetical protein
VQIVNIGRAGGNINQIDIETPGQERKEYDVVDGVRFKGFPEETFRPIALPATASMLVIIRAPAGRAFAADVRIAVDIGTPNPKYVPPASTDYGLAGLPSVLPPGALLEPVSQGTAQVSIGDQLTKLVQLRDAEVLSPEEFDQAKAKLLG